MARIGKLLFKRVEQLIMELGLPINKDKVVQPADIMTCIGIEVNARDKTVRISQGKMNETIAECEGHQSQEITVTDRQVTIRS